MLVFQVLKKLLFWTALIVFSGVALAEDRALIVAIGDYERGVHRLPGAQVDAVLMEEVLRHLGFRAQQIETLVDEEATAANIRAAFERIIRASEANDRVYIHYSGHGLQQVDGADGDEADGCDEAWLSYDSRKILDDEIRVWLERLAGVEVMMTVDSCFSGEIYKDTSRLLPRTSSNPEMRLQCNREINRDAQSSGQSLASYGVDDSVEFVGDSFVGFSAAAENELAYETPSGGVFTRTLHGIVTNIHHPISFYELRDLLASNVNRQVNAIEGERQTPLLFGSRALMGKNIFDFGRLSGAQDLVGYGEVASSTQAFFDDLLYHSHFTPLVYTAKDRLRQDGAGLEVVVPNREYHIGEEIRFSLRSPRAGYLHLFELDPSNTLSLVYPNSIMGEQNYLAAEQDFHVPEDAIGSHHLAADYPTGRSRIIALVTPEPLNLYQSVFGEARAGLKVFADSELATLERLLQQETARAIAPTPPDSHYGASELLIDIVE